MTVIEEMTSELKRRKISQREFAKRIGISHSVLNMTLKGHRPINIEIALGFELLYIKTATYWMTKKLKEEIKQAKELDDRF